MAAELDRLNTAIRQKADKLRALGVTGSRRSPLMPDVPTIAEAGLPGYEFETWFMVFAPAATPQAIVDKLNVALNEALATPAVSIDGVIKLSGRIPKPDEVKAWLQ